MTQHQFLNLIHEHKGILIKLSKFYLDNEEDQKDLRQEMIYQLWKSIQSFQGKSKFSTWMYRVALNTAIVYHRKEKKRISLPNQLKKEPISNGYDSSKDEELNCFYKAVHSLNKIDKAILFSYLEGSTGKEISALLELSEINVRVRMNRIKTKLKIHISKCMQESLEQDHFPIQ